jgi:hypothetical protein
MTGGVAVVGSIVMALGNLLSELEVNGPLYSLNSVDVMLIATASEVLETVAQPADSSTMQVIAISRAGSATTPVHARPLKTV